MADSPKPVDSVDALAAMAGGANLDQKDPQAPAEPLAPDAIDAILAAGGSVPPEPFALAEAPVIGDGAAEVPIAAVNADVRRTTRVRMQQNADKALAVQFKRFMIPLLLTVGVILIGMGVFALVISRPAGQTIARFERGFSLPHWAMWLGLISLAVGGILLVGAWYFRMELHDLDRTKRDEWLHAGGLARDRFIKGTLLKVNVRTARPWGSLNWPNRISILRLLMVAPFVALLLYQQDWLWARHVALGIFVVMALSDFVDGQLARRLNLRTRLGAILDPLADKVLIICSVVLLSVPAYSPKDPDLTLPTWVAVAVVGKDLWVIMGVIVVYLVTDRLRIQPTVAGKLSTVMQLAMVILVMISPDLEKLCDGLGVRISRVMAYMVAAVSVLAIISYTRLGLSFVAQEQKPLDENHANKNGMRK